MIWTNLTDINCSFNINCWHVHKPFTLTNALQHSTVSKHQLPTDHTTQSYTSRHQVTYIQVQSNLVTMRCLCSWLSHMHTVLKQLKVFFAAPINLALPSQAPQKNFKESTKKIYFPPKCSCIFLKIQEAEISSTNANRKSADDPLWFTSANKSSYLFLELYLNWRNVKSCNLRSQYVKIDANHPTIICLSSTKTKPCYMCKTNNQPRDFNKKINRYNNSNDDDTTIYKAS